MKDPYIQCMSYMRRFFFGLVYIDIYQLPLILTVLLQLPDKRCLYITAGHDDVTLFELRR